MIYTHQITRSHRMGVITITKLQVISMMFFTIQKVTALR